MTTSFDGKNIIKKFEGLRLTAYKCSANVDTIGYGHTGGVKPGDVITQAEAERLLDEDLKKYEAAVNAALDGLTQNQFDALVSFTYNVGGEAFRTSTLLKTVKANPQDSAIRREFMKWINAGGKPNEGIKKRREQEANLYFR
jgi:lysozyme